MIRQRLGVSTFVCIQDVRVTVTTDSHAELHMKRTMGAAMTRCARQDTVVSDVSIQHTVTRAHAMVTIVSARTSRSIAPMRT